MSKHLNPAKDSLVRVLDETSELVNKEGIVFEIREATIGDLYPISVKEYCVKFEGGIEAWFTARQLLRLKKPVKPMSYYRPPGSQKKFKRVDWTKIKNELPTYVSIVEFAVIKECYPEKVYAAIDKGLVEIVTVGLTQEKILIDLKKHEALVLKTDNTAELQERWEIFMRKNWPKMMETINELKKAGKI